MLSPNRPLGLDETRKQERAVCGILLEHRFGVGRLLLVQGGWPFRETCFPNYQITRVRILSLTG